MDNLTEVLVGLPFNLTLADQEHEGGVEWPIVCDISMEKLSMLTGTRWIIDRAVDVTNSVLLKIADDTKVARVVESEELKEEMQATISNLVQRSADWQMLFNTGKCHLFHLVKRKRKWLF